MATPVIMPKQGQSVESCIIGKWYRKPGEAVKAGEPLFAYETDKAAFEEPAPVDGTLLAVFFQEGDDVPCLLNVCAIGAPGEDVAALAPAGATTAPPAAAAPQPRSTPCAVPSAARHPAWSSPTPRVSPGIPWASVWKMSWP